MGSLCSIVHEGDCFGTGARAQRAAEATVRAKGKLNLLKIEAQAFKQLIGVLEFDKVYCHPLCV